MKVYHQSTFERWPFDDKSIQAIITSPPFYSLRKYDIPDVIIGDWKGQHGLEPTFQQYIDHTLLWCQEAWRVLRDDGCFFLNLGDSYASGKGSCLNPGGGENSLGISRKEAGAHPLHRGNLSDLKAQGISPKCKLLIPHRVAIALIDAGWTLRNDIIWYKPNAMPESVTDRFSKKFEYIFMFVKSQKYYFDLDAVREKWDEDSIKRLFRGNTGQAKYGGEIDEGSQPVASMSQKRHNRTKEYKEYMSGSGKSFPGHSGYTKKDGSPIVRPEGKNPGDVWIINTQPSPEKHYAMWPESLVERMIKCSTKPGDIVCDPFAGSGTTLRVADKLNREAYGIDLGYEDIQARRLSNVQKELI